jgi:predicted permease
VSAWQRFGRRLAAQATGRDNDQRVREEIEDHLSRQTEANIQAGLPPAEARRQAILKFGGVQAVREQYRDGHRLPVVERLSLDVRSAWRQLRRTPLFTVTAIVILAVGIGANASIFTLVDRVLLRRLPVTDPQNLVFVTDQRSLTQRSPTFSYPLYQALEANDVLAGIAARSTMGVNASADGQASRAQAELISGSYFGVLGVPALVGRVLTRDDDRSPGAHPVVVISDAYWRRMFASDPSVAGRTIRINNSVFTIVGVAAEEFTGVEVGAPTDIWVPMAMQREVGRDFLNDARSNWLGMVGRLKPGTGVDAAGAALTSLLERQPGGAPAPASGHARTFMLVPADKGGTALRRELGPALQVLMALTAVMLLLECFTLASLLVMRSLARQKETATRLALGARRSHLVRQHLTETVMLAALGGAVGLMVAPWLTAVLVASYPSELRLDTSVDPRVFGFGMGVTLLTGLLVGLAPILASTKAGVALASWHASRTATGTRRHLLLRDVIVTSQIAASLAMLIVAALLAQSLQGLAAIDRGFRGGEVLLMSIDPGPAGYGASRIEGFWRTVLERVGRIPGVRSVSLARTIPLAPGRQRQPIVNPASGLAVEIDLNFVGPQYFRTLGVALVRGREFDEQDGRTSRPVAVVNERLAERFWPGQDPIGREIRTGRSAAAAIEVIGVVKDVKYRDLRSDADAMLYVPILQTTSTSMMTLHVLVDAGATALAAPIRRELQAIDPTLPAFGVRTIDDQVNAFLAQPRQAAALTGGFGVLALILSAIGVYGVTAMAVRRQTHEIGIRVALGARPGHIALMIGRRGLTVVTIGIALGLLVSSGLARLAGTLLYGVTPTDASTFAGTSALLLMVSLVAVYLPARTATRLDAARAMRCD